MSLASESRIVARHPSLKPLAKLLSVEIAKLTGINLPTASGPDHAGDIILTIDPTIKAGEEILTVQDREVTRTTDGAHAITIGDRAVIRGFDYRATAEGTSTILQLLTRTEGGFCLPHVAINDWPHADFCGVMLDVGRQDHPIEAIKKVVEICRVYKARYLQLHLTDDQGWTFPSTKYPQLGSRNYGAHGGIAPRVYKIDELKALVAYADARGVTIVPEFEMPGHCGAAQRSLPEIFDAINPQSNQPVGMGCMNMSNEAIYPALDTIIGEMCEVFQSSPYFHIGSDEVSSGRLSLHPGYKAFMAKHGLKDDQQLADFFIAKVCDIVKKHGKKAIKWEGLSNSATKDVIIMAWDANSNVAAEMQARGYTTITCPWTLGVPWQDWNMYICNGSRLKKTDSVLGATLVAWEQPPLTHITNLRNLASRQERTWGPDNSVTEAGFASRFQPLDALVGKLIDMPPNPRLDATISTTMRASDFLDPVFAIDGNDATFFKSLKSPKAGDHLTLSFPQPKQVYAIDVRTGLNRHGQLDGGEIQVSSDGTSFSTVATLKNGSAWAILNGQSVRSVRVRVAADQIEPLVLREITPSFLVEVSGAVKDPAKAIGERNVAAIKGKTEFMPPIGTVASPIINDGFTLKLNSGGSAAHFSGPILGKGSVEIYAGGLGAPIVLDGTGENAMRGTWAVKRGQVELSKRVRSRAMSGTVIVGGNSDQDSLVWKADCQLDVRTSVQLLNSPKGGASLNLNGFNEVIARLTLDAGTKILTDGPAGGGVLAVQELIVDGKKMPKGAYASSGSWLRGSGHVLVGDVKSLSVSGVVDDPDRTLGAGNFAALESAAEFKLPAGECTVSATTREFPLTLLTERGKSRFSGFITGNGPLNLSAAKGTQLEISGASSNSYKGATTLTRGILRLNKSGNAIAIPGNLTLGGSASDNDGDSIIWDADGQVASSTTVAMSGTQPCNLDLNGHQTALNRISLSRSARIRTGDGGRIHVRQFFIDGQRLKDGVYHAPQPWLEGTGVVTVDSRVNIQGIVGSPESIIGVGNLGNMTGDTTIIYPSSGGDFDIATNGHTLTLDSGNGNAFAYAGSISGSGNVVFLMGPSYTGFRDAPMCLAGAKPNTLTGKFLVKKGRVQLEKPEGVDAISGDVIVGGQGFNDCLFWKNSHQIKDTVNITLLDAGNNGAAYLHLNGCHETIASLTMTANNKILTDSADGKGGTLTVKALSIGGVAKAAGAYTAATEQWIEGKGRIIIQP